MTTNPGAAGPPRGHVNELGGPVAGPVVQARDVRGGVHFHGVRHPVPVPRQLPGAGLLVNRADALAALGQGPPQDGAVVVSGPAGIGKTAVALHWAHRNLARFPDGQLFVDLQGHSAAGPVLPGEALGRFLRALGVPDESVPVETAERAALFRSLAAARRMLVVLDDAYSAAQVGPLLPGTAGSAAVVTSRWRLGGLVVRGARGVQLGPLGRDAALELLDAALGAERVAPELGMAERLVEQCERSPLALRIAAARLATRPGRSLSAMVRELTHERRRLAVLAAQDAEGDVTIRAALTLSYRNLPEPVRHLYRMLGVHPGVTFDGRTAAALAGVPVPAAEDGLDLLAEANLLDDLPDGRYRFHNLVRLHARELAEQDEPAAARREAVRRLAEWSVVAALAASRAIAPYRRLADPGFRTPEPPAFAGAAEALAWLDEEFGNLRPLARRALECGLHRQTWLLVDVSWPLFLHRGHHAERLDFDRVGLAAARADGDLVAEAKLLNRTGLALRALGRPDEAAADFAAALDLWRRLGDSARVAGVRRRLGLLELDRGAVDAAADHFGAALDAYRAAGENRRAALTLCDLGAALVKAGRAAAAVEPLTEAGRLLAAESDPYNRARVLVLLGQAQAHGPDPAAAAASVERGLAAMREIGSAIGEADALHVLGDLAHRDGRTAEARGLYTRAREILAGTGAPTRVLDERLTALGDGGD
ncbi:tetratricopeptide repeat protein [Actinomadura sp. 6K520]|uniref:tetratricopeptide repeat protein n=1 Tax=Actinomadura sp. 6K520 TaxID=2530364 RepID=UPI00104C28D8|nr:tetratricopeptide repeat protein [Actinomadura sp. 6K520]TDE20825.1 tetratricopeptide repeat protein [Actinomadura sp. 6K520]